MLLFKNKWNQDKNDNRFKFTTNAKLIKKKNSESVHDCPGSTLVSEVTLPKFAFFPAVKSIFTDVN